MSEILDIFKIGEIDTASLRTEKEVKRVNVIKFGLLWVIQHTQLPSDSQVVTKVLASTFSLLNTSVVENKIIATKIVARLLSTNIDFVHVERTKKFVDKMCASLTFRETPLLQILAPTLVRLVIHADEKKNPEDRDFYFCHQYVDQIVYELQFVEDQEHVLLYYQHLRLVLEFLGIFSTYHLKQLLSSMYTTLYTYTINIKICLSVFAVIKTLVSHCWPRMGYHKENIFIALSNAYVESVDEECIPNQDFKTAIKEIFGMLRHCPSEDFDEREAVKGLPLLEELLEVETESK
eukprot:TRINITY_DN7012_c0_g1_i1.p1 TRINITY_DN7012_c0_g1~~TRINITY_DN7012_c0_g1_i1.p1  ORF type:complete len:292 (+),score=45.12 TRINITY_DN7012_c0_g1_i1:1224-2099(+)